MRVAYLGPAGTNTQEALLAAGRRSRAEPSRCATIHDCDRRAGRRGRARVRADRELARGLRQRDARRARGRDRRRRDRRRARPRRSTLPDRARAARARARSRRSSRTRRRIAQCAHFLRRELPQARVVPASSTAEAVRSVAEQRRPRGAALGSRARGGAATAARSCARASTTRPATRRASCGSRRAGTVRPRRARPAGRRRSCSGASGAEAPGWLVRCLSEFAFRGVNLTQDRVAAAQAGPRPLHLLRRPRGPRLGRARSPRRSRGCATHCRAPPRARLLSRGAERSTAARCPRPSAQRGRRTTGRYTSPTAWPTRQYHQRKLGPRRLWSTSGADVSLAGCSSSTRRSSRSTSAPSGAPSCCC